MRALTDMRDISDGGGHENGLGDAQLRIFAISADRYHSHRFHQKRLLRAMIKSPKLLKIGTSRCQTLSADEGISSFAAHQLRRTRYIPFLGDGVQSGNGRTSANDDNTDFYSVPLKQDALRPGTIYADPYGHVLMLVRRVPQSGGTAGVFLAVDAEPDGTVTRKRFWRGNFLFVHDPSLGSPGFKRFRPIVREANGSLRRLTNAEIAKDPDYGDFSLEQTQLATEDFYDRMDDVMSPEPLDPMRAMKEVITALEEQVQARITAVENGRKFQNSGRGDAVMPDGASTRTALGRTLRRPRATLGC